MGLLDYKNLSAAAVTVILAGFVPGADASISILDTPGTEASPFTLGGVASVTYAVGSSQLADRIAYGANADFNPQNPTNIGLKISSIFNLSGPIYLSSYTDGTVLHDAQQTGDGAKTGSFTSDFAFKFLALHFGNNELIFDFSSTGGVAAGVTFSIGNLPNGLSNWRAYDVAANNPANPDPIGGPAPVPVPAAVWLFGSALAGWGAIKFGNKTKSA